MRFLSSETGAVTVDWVVLTAGLVGLGLATTAVVSTGAQDASDDVSDQLTSTVIATGFGGMRDQELLQLYDDYANSDYYLAGGHPLDINAAVDSMVGNFDTMNDAGISSSANMFANIQATQEEKLAALETAVAGMDPGLPDVLDLAPGMLFVNGDTEEEQRAFIQGEIDRAGGLDAYVQYRTDTRDIVSGIQTRYKDEATSRGL